MTIHCLRSIAFGLCFLSKISYLFLLFKENLYLSSKQLQTPKRLIEEIMSQSPVQTAEQSNISNNLLYSNILKPPSTFQASANNNGTNKEGEKVI